MRKTNRRIAPLAAGLLLAAAAAWAQEWRGDAGLEVKVSSRKGGALAGARVEMMYRDGRGESGPAAVATDAKGRAALNGLAAGTWQIEVSHPEFMSYVAVIRLSPKAKPEVTASFLEATSASTTPIQVKLLRSRGGLSSPPLPVAIPPTPEPTPAAPQPEPAEPPPATTPAVETPRVETPAPESQPEPATEETPAPEIPASEIPTAETPAPEPPRPEPPEPEAPQPETPRPGPPEPEAPTAEVPAPEGPMPEPAPMEPAVAESEPRTAVTAPEMPAPEAAVAEPTPTAPTLPAPAPPRWRAYQERTCPECRPGEWAVTMAAAVASDGSCSESVRDKVADALATLAARPALQLAGFAGGVDGAVALLDSGDAAGVQNAFGAADADGCRILGVVLPKGSRFVGFQYEIEDGDGRRPCLPDQPCPGGGAAFAGPPRIARGSASTIVHSLAHGSGLAANVLMTVFFRSPNDTWTPER